MDTKPTAKTPPIAPKKLLGKNGFKYQPKYGVIVMCKDEPDQIKTFNQLTAGGYKVKVVCV